MSDLEFDALKMMLRVCVNNQEIELKVCMYM